MITYDFEVILYKYQTGKKNIHFLYRRFLHGWLDWA